MTEEREPDDTLGMRTAVFYGQESPPSYAAAAAGGTTPPTAVLADAASEQSTEEDVRAESVEPVYCTSCLPHLPPGLHISLIIICVYCVHFAFLGIEICGTKNVLIVTGLREKNSRR